MRMDRVQNSKFSLTLLRFHTMDPDFSQFGPDYAVRPAQVYVAVAGQGDAGGREDVLFLESLHQFRQLFLRDLEQTNPAVNICRSREYGATLKVDGR